MLVVAVDMVVLTIIRVGVLVDRVLVEMGPHMEILTQLEMMELQTLDPVAVVVYGYDDYVSYGYPGGLNLDVVDPETGDVIDMPAGE